MSEKGIENIDVENIENHTVSDRGDVNLNTVEGVNESRETDYSTNVNNTWEDFANEKTFQSKSKEKYFKPINIENKIS